MQINGKHLPAASKRLQILYQEATTIAANSDVVVDVGSDHGYLAAMLAASEKYSAVIATDISVASLKKTIELSSKYNLKIVCKVCSGMDDCPEATLACICGMGGYEIIHILQQYNAKFAENYVINNDCDVKKSTKTAKLVQKKCKNAIRCKKFVLQPVQNATELRLWLLENNYKIIKDYCFEDKGKFYFVFVVDGYGKNKYSKNDKIFGKTNLKNKTSDFILYLKDQQKKLKFLENFDKLNITKTSEKEIKQKLKYYKKTEKIIKGSKIYDSRNN